MVAFGKSKSESRVTAEFYNAAIGVMRGAERASRYRALDRQEAFDIEYWLLEEAKLKRMPPERALDRQVVVVVGAGSGIGRALCRGWSPKGRRWRQWIATWKARSRRPAPSRQKSVLASESPVRECRVLDR